MSARPEATGPDLVLVSGITATQALRGLLDLALDLDFAPSVKYATLFLISLDVARSMTAQDVIAQLDRLVEQRGAPQFIRSDNGAEFVAKEVQKWIKNRGFETLFIAPESPWQNAYSESFNSRFRDEFLNVELFTSLLEAKVLGEEHQYKYNHQRPHSSLGDLTPAGAKKTAKRAVNGTSLLQSRKPNQINCLTVLCDPFM